MGNPLEWAKMLYRAVGATYPTASLIPCGSGILVKEATRPMIAFHAHFDGKVIVPEHPVDLPVDRTFVVHVETPRSADPEREIGPSGLQWLAANAVEDELPSDLAAQHDHYLYGTAKRR